MSISSFPPPAATYPYRVTVVNRRDGSDGPRVRVMARDADHAVELAQLDLGTLGRHVVIRRLPDPASHCHRCERYVSPRETGLADLRRQRVWCKSCGLLVTLPEMAGLMINQQSEPLIDLNELGKAFVDGALEGGLLGDK